MTAYKLVLSFADSSLNTHFHEIRYFINKESAEKVNLQLQTFLFENPRDPYIKQVLREYPSLILKYQSIENEKEKLAMQEKIKTLQRQIEKFIKFVSWWPENTQMALIYYFSRNLCNSEIVEFEIEE